MSDEPEGWLCVCGHYQEDDFHCSKCGAEPPWGCDCGMHDEPDDPSDLDSWDDSDGGDDEDTWG